jgi:hypothetical protein
MCAAFLIAQGGKKAFSKQKKKSFSGSQREERLFPVRGGI